MGNFQTYASPSSSSLPHLLRITNLRLQFTRRYRQYREQYIRQGPTGYNISSAFSVRAITFPDHQPISAFSPSTSLRLWPAEMCEIRRLRFPCCNRETWVYTKNPSFCESLAPGSRCQPSFCMFIGAGVEEVKGGICQECLKNAPARNNGQQRAAAWQLYGRPREGSSMDVTRTSEHPQLDTAVSGRILHTMNDRNETSANSSLTTPNYGNGSSKSPAVDNERGSLLHCADQGQATDMGVGTISESNFDPSYPFNSSFWEIPIPSSSTEVSAGVANPQAEVTSFAQEGSSSGNGPHCPVGNPQSGIQLLQSSPSAPGSTLGFSDAWWENAQLASDSPDVNQNTSHEGSFDVSKDWNFHQSESNPPK